MAVNSFIAALGNILEGASSDRERTRKLKELEEEREYTRLERRQLAEDRAERRAREKQAEADRLEALGYESETVLKSRLAGLGDAPAYEPGAASFDLGMDGVASKLAGTSLKPSPFSGSRLGVIGQDPFDEATMQAMVDNADKTEQRRETQRRLASLVDVAGQGRMYATTRAQQLAAEEKRLAGVTERADVAAMERRRIENQAATKQLSDLLDSTSLTPAQRAGVMAGVDINNTVVSANTAATIAQKDRENAINAGKAKGSDAAKDRERLLMFSNLKDSIEQYRTNLEKTGIEVYPTRGKTLTSSTHMKLILQVKELEKLGAISMKDAEMMEGILADPTSIASAFNNVLNLGSQAGNIGAQLDQFQDIANNQLAQYQMSMGRKPLTIHPDDFATLNKKEQQQTRSEGYSIRSSTFGWRPQ